MLPPNLQEVLGRALRHLRRATEVMSAVATFIEDVIDNNEALATMAIAVAEEMVSEAEESAKNGDVVMAIKELGDAVPWLEWKINDLMNRINHAPNHGG